MRMDGVDPEMDIIDLAAGRRRRGLAFGAGPAPAGYLVRLNLLITRSTLVSLVPLMK
jgi:hypothetical protein